MKKIINKKVLCIPPYLSASWDSISSLHLKEGILFVSLLDGDSVQIPGLPEKELELIFSLHAEFLNEEDSQEEGSEASSSNPFQKLEELGEIFQSKGEQPFQVAFGANLGAAMQHNPSQSNLPDLPEEILDKVAAISRIISPEELQNSPEPEANCNCIYCQIAGAIRRSLSSKREEPEEEPVSDQELQFCQWNIEQTGEKLFTLVNRLDPDETYRVYLGSPIGCTCGKEHCEHIIAVLKS